MKYILLTTMLLLSACDQSPAPTPKIAEPQREALDKAKGVDQTLQKAADQQQKEIDEAAGK